MIDNLQIHQLRVLSAIARKYLCSLAFGVILLFPLAFSLAPSAYGHDSSQGEGESVIENIAKEHGREAKEPLITGDLLLLAFLSVGTIGGFAAGYYWRMLLESRQNNDRRKTHEHQ